MELDHKPLTREDLLPEMARSYRLLLSGLGEDPDRQVCSHQTSHGLAC